MESGSCQVGGSLVEMVRMCMTDEERRRVQAGDVAEAFRPVVMAEVEACAKLDESPVVDLDPDAERILRENLWELYTSGDVKLVTQVTDAVGVDSTAGVGKVVRSGSDDR